MPNSQEAMMVRVRDLIESDPMLIMTFKPKYVTLELWEYAVSARHEVFEHCKHKTYNICALALASNGLYLESIDPENYTGTQYAKLCDIAVQQNPKAYGMVPKEFRTKDMQAFALSSDSEILASQKNLSASTVEEMITLKPSLIQYVVDPTDAMIIKALSIDPRTIVYFKQISPNVRQWYEEHFPQHAAMLVHD